MRNETIGLIGLFVLLAGFVVLAVALARSQRVIESCKRAAYQYLGVSDPDIDDDEAFKRSLPSLAEATHAHVQVVATTARKLMLYLQRLWPGIDTNEYNAVSPILSAYVLEALAGRVTDDTRVKVEQLLALAESWELDAQQGARPSAHAEQLLSTWQYDVLQLMRTAEYIGKRISALQENARLLA